MKRRLSIAAGALVLAIAIPAMTLAGAPRSVFTGSWESTDIPDGSHQTLVVSSGARPSVVYQDFYAHGCDTYSWLPADHWTAAGTGSVEGDFLLVSFRKSGCGAFLMGGYEDSYEYHAGTDTLTDGVGIIWYRTN